MKKGQSYQLNSYMEADLLEMFHGLSTIKASTDGFLAMVLQCPARVTVQKIGLESNKILKMLMATHWLDWQKNMYKWIVVYGICPWYVVKIRKTKHKYPISPPFQSGTISTYMDKNHIQRFEWKWIDGKVDDKMRFETKNYNPTVFGGFTTPLVSLLSSYRTLKIAREAKERSWHIQSNRQHIIEYNPNRKQVEEDSIGINRTYRPDTFSGRNSTTNPAPLQKTRVKDAAKALREAQLLNSLTIDSGQTMYMHTDDPDQPQMNALSGEIYHLEDL